MLSVPKKTMFVDRKIAGLVFREDWEPCRSDDTYVIPPEPVPEVCTHEHTQSIISLSQWSHDGGQEREGKWRVERRTLRDMRNLVRLVAIRGHILDDMNIGSQHGMQNVRLQAQ